jgi:hypothetical protein
LDAAVAALVQQRVGAVNKTPTEQGIAPPCKNTPIPGLAEDPSAVDPKTTTCLTPPRPVLWCKSSEVARNICTIFRVGRLR